MLTFSILQASCFACIADAVSELMCLPKFIPALMLPLNRDKADYIGPNSVVWGALMEAEATKEFTGIKQDLC